MKPSGPVALSDALSSDAILFTGWNNLSSQCILSNLAEPRSRKQLAGLVSPVYLLCSQGQVINPLRTLVSSIVN